MISRIILFTSLLATSVFGFAPVGNNAALRTSLNVRMNILHIFALFSFFHIILIQNIFLENRLPRVKYHLENLTDPRFVLESSVHVGMMNM